MANSSIQKSSSKNSRRRGVSANLKSKSKVKVAENVGFRGFKLKSEEKEKYMKSIKNLDQYRLENLVE